MSIESDFIKKGESLMSDEQKSMSVDRMAEYIKHMSAKNGVTPEVFEEMIKTLKFDSEVLDGSFTVSINGVKCEGIYEDGVASLTKRGGQPIMTDYGPLRSFPESKDHLRGMDNDFDQKHTFALGEIIKEFHNSGVN